MKSCKKLGVDPVQCISKALRRGQEVKVQNRVLDALEMLCLTNALVVRKNNFRSTTSCIGISSAILLVDAVESQSDAFDARRQPTWR